MKHDLQVHLLKELMQQLDEGKNADAGAQYKIPAAEYVCETTAQKEWETFFQTHPQLIGLSGDLPEPHSFFTVDDFAVPVLATRDEAGNFRAFINACRHRGVQVTSATRGTARKFVCPFHAWTYSTNGALVGVPQEDHFGDVNKNCHSLVELPAEERAGMLWVHPQPHGTLDVDALLGPLAEEIASGNYGDLVYYGETRIDGKLNWKLANDTFGETYHFQKLHKNTLGQIYYGDNLAYEAFGRNHRFVFANKAIDALRTEPEETWQLSHGANMLYYLFPNIQLNVSGPGSLSLIRIYPDPKDTGRSITKVNHYFARDLVEQMENAPTTEDRLDASNIYEGVAEGKIPTLSAVTEVFESTVEQEDYAMGESIQRSATNGTIKDFVFGRNEPALHHFHNSFRAMLGKGPLEKV